MLSIHCIAMSIYRYLRMFNTCYACKTLCKDRSHVVEFIHMENNKEFKQVKNVSKSHKGYCCGGGAVG